MTRRGTATPGARAGRRSAAALVGARGLALAAHGLDRCRTLEDVQATTTRLGVDVLGAQRVAFCRIEQDTCRILEITPMPTDPRVLWVVRSSFRAEDRPALGALIRERTSWVAHAVDINGEPVTPDDHEAGDPVEIATLDELGAGSALAAPIVVNGTVWGQVYAVRRRDGGLFSVDDVARAEVLAALAAGAIARVDLEDQVRHLVADDPLTGLANRRVADSVAESALESGDETCIVMCDVDGLKRVNDQMGHDAGDDLLRTVADVLRRVADALPGTTAARIGGDEFALVTVGRRRAEVVETMSSTLAMFPLPHGAAISYGVASTAVSGPVSARQLFRRADVEQYRAKRARARRLQVATPTADPGVTAERVVVVGSAAIAAAQSGVVPRLCAFAAAVTETLGGSAWAVLMKRGDTASAIARGGSPADLEGAQSTTTLEHGSWQVEIGVSSTAAEGGAVRAALEALTAVAVVGAS
ncbi:sensor domain-containing diguanylate cyclase [Cellulomonas sp. JH27-2]|uniref:GGDEF domain-containing protein n=1 Tax=Cellulomonas sp. JH27-2 TaxID=2774139 RepID=UPI00178621C4|nr:sensor domain-containing diguanylate cyclase [Cellulomonas sp. JH27-2]